MLTVPVPSPAAMSPPCTMNSSITRWKGTLAYDRPLCSPVHNWRKLWKSRSQFHFCLAGLAWSSLVEDDVKKAHSLFRSAGRLVRKEFNDQPARRLRTDMDVEEDSRIGFGRHGGARTILIGAEGILLMSLLVCRSPASDTAAGRAAAATA